MSTWRKIDRIDEQLSTGTTGVSDPSVVSAVNDVETAILGLMPAAAVLTDSFAVEQRDDDDYKHAPIFLHGYADNLTTTFSAPDTELVPEKQFFNTINGQFVSIVSTSALDDASPATGARTVTVHRIDNNGLEVTSTFVMDGQVPVIIGNTRIILDAFVSTAVTFMVNQGTISLYHSNDGAVLGVPGDPAQIHGVIPAPFVVMRKSATLSTTDVLYLASISGHCDGPAVIRLESTLLSQCVHVIVERSVDGEFSIPLHSHAPIAIDCFIRVLAASVAGTVTLSYTVTAFQKQV